MDYHNLEALAAVIEEKGFEKAGESLHITQSAVTQRIRQLEESTGQVLLVRSRPPVPTGAGRLLLEHFRKVRILEQEFSAGSGMSISPQKPLIPLAVNADSMATWFSDVIGAYFALDRGFLDIRSADQDVTHELMTDGEVMGCVSSKPTAFKGCRRESLGKMVYRFVSTREFANRFFPEGVDADSFARAPKMNFNKDDQLLANWADQFFAGIRPFRNSHFIPSSEQFPVLIRKGSVCGMLPEDQFEADEDRFHLIDLSMDRPVSTSLYWHRWSIPSKELDILTEIVRKEAKNSLTP